MHVRARRMCSMFGSSSHKSSQTAPQRFEPSFAVATGATRGGRNRAMEWETLPAQTQALTTLSTWSGRWHASGTLDVRGRRTIYAVLRVNGSDADHHVADQERNRHIAAARLGNV